MASEPFAHSTADVVVIGGGITGLLAARRASHTGRSVIVIEASDRLGGRLASVTLEGISLDAGAESFATRGGHVQRLCEELGLGADVVEPLRDPAWVVGPRAAYPLPATSWLGIPAHPFARDVRRVLGWSGALRAATDLVRPGRAVRAGATVGSVSRDRLGARATDRLVAPVVSGVYTRDINVLPLDSLAEGLTQEVAENGLIRAARARRAASPPGAAVRSLRGGLHRLIDVVAADAVAHGARIETGAAVTALAPTSDGWVITTPSQRIEAGQVVLAIPPHHVDELVGRPHTFAGPVPGPARYVAIESLMVDAPQLDVAPRGTGVLAQPGLTRAKALTHASAKWEWLAQALPRGRHVMRLSYTLSHAGEEVASHAVSDASALLGVDIDPSTIVARSTHVWLDAAPSTPPTRLPRGLHVLGAGAGLTGLAAITHQVSSADFV